MFSNEMQRLILQIHKNNFGIYMSDQNVYKHQRSFYRAAAYLEKHQIIFKSYIPIVNKTRITLTATGKILGYILESVEEKNKGVNDG